MLVQAALFPFMFNHQPVMPEESPSKQPGVNESAIRILKAPDGRYGFQQAFPEIRDSPYHAVGFPLDSQRALRSREGKKRREVLPPMEPALQVSSRDVRHVMPPSPFHGSAALQGRRRLVKHEASQPQHLIRVRHPLKSGQLCKRASDVPLLRECRRRKDTKDLRSTAQQSVSAGPGNLFPKWEIRQTCR